MSTSSSLSVNNQKGIAHIFIFIVILLVVVAAVLIFLGIQAYKSLSTPPSQAQYTNPFDQEATYENPFEDYQNPFEDLQ